METKKVSQVHFQRPATYIKDICGLGGIIAGRRAVNYHTHYTLFIDNDYEFVFYEKDFGKLLNYAKLHNLKIEKEKFYKTVNKSEEIPFIKFNKDSWFIIIPVKNKKKIGYIQENGRKIADINSTIRYFKEWKNRGDIAIKALERIKHGKKNLTLEDSLRINPPHNIVLGRSL